MHKLGGNSKRKSRKCPRVGCKNKATISPRLGVLPCKKHQEEDAGKYTGKPYQFATLSKSDRINEERDVWGKDLIQPWKPDGKTINPDFVEAYPDKAEDYYSKQELEKL